MRILVAEDERITRASLARQLEGLGHTVVAAEDGRQAWEHFAAGPFDMVITDWEMPNLSGVDLIARIRAAHAASYVYIIMLTGRTDKADTVRGIEAGADDFLSKPFDKGELRARVLSGERVVRLERTLSAQNEALRQASDRMRRDLRAAARVQQAMLPKRAVVTERVSTAWTYVPTDELAGDAIGLELIDDRYLVAYVVDVSGHGVPAALLSVTAMHALALAGEDVSLMRDPRRRDGLGTLRRPASVIADLNRRFSARDNDGRFLTMIHCVLDTLEGRLHFARAGHPLPILVRAGEPVEVSDAGGPPIGLLDDAEYEGVVIDLHPGDRLLLYSDGLIEQSAPSSADQFGEQRVVDCLRATAGASGDRAVAHAVDALAAWAGERRFTDDVSLVVADWLGPSGGQRAPA